MLSWPDIMMHASQRATFVNGLNKISERERERDWLFVSSNEGSNDRKIPQKFPCIRDTYDRGSKMKYRFDERYFLRRKGYWDSFNLLNTIQSIGMQIMLRRVNVISRSSRNSLNFKIFNLDESIIIEVVV